MTPSAVSNLLENLNQMASQAKKDNDLLLLSIISACDEATREGLYHLANHLLILTLAVRDRKRSNPQAVEFWVSHMYGESDSETGRFMYSYIEEEKRKKHLESLEKD